MRLDAHARIIVGLEQRLVDAERIICDTQDSTSLRLDALERARRGEGGR